MDAKWQSLARGLGAAVLLAVFAQNGTAAMDSPDAVELNSLQNIYQGATFDHAMHNGVAVCAVCHHHTAGTPPVDESCKKCHKDGAKGVAVACAGCHPASPGRPSEKITKVGAAAQYHLDVAGLKRAYHVRCMGCHQEMGAATGCEDCHAKKDKRG